MSEAAKKAKQIFATTTHDLLKWSKRNLYKITEKIWNQLKIQENLEENFKLCLKQLKKNVIESGNEYDFENDVITITVQISHLDMENNREIISKQSYSWVNEQFISQRFDVEEKELND